MDNEALEEASAKVIEMCRRLFRRAAEEMEAKGARIEDVAIGLAYASQDVAARYKGDHHAALEWLRTCTDLQERQLLKRGGAGSRWTLGGKTGVSGKRYSR